MSGAFNGVHWMLATPFDEREELDTDSIAKLVVKAKETGCADVVALGMMGEAYRLTDRELRIVAESVLSAADGLPVTLGTSAASTMMAIARSQEAQQLGASAVMLAPPPSSSAEDVYAHYCRVAEAIDLPIVVQDLPETTGVHMPPALFLELAENIPSVLHCKIEDPPTPPKITAIQRAGGRAANGLRRTGGTVLIGRAGPRCGGRHDRLRVSGNPGGGVRLHGGRRQSERGTGLLSSPAADPV